MGQSRQTPEMAARAALALSKAITAVAEAVATLEEMGYHESAIRLGSALSSFNGIRKNLGG